MTRVVVSLHDQVTELRYPERLRRPVDLLFGRQPARPARRPNQFISVRETAPDRYSIRGNTGRLFGDRLTEAELLDALLDELVHSLIYQLDTAVALHAAVIGWRSKSILIPGPTSAGKTSLAGWFVAKDFEFLSDELVVLPKTGRAALTFPRPLLAKSETDELIAVLARAGHCQVVRTAANIAICLDRPSAGAQDRPPGLIVFPNFVSGSELNIESVSPARTGLKLMGCNLNARNLADHGLEVLAEVGRNVPALEVTYGDYEQLNGVLDSFARFVLEHDADVGTVQRFTAAFHAVAQQRPAASPRAPVVKTVIPEATPWKPPKKITIGMATYDDYDGVYFTLQGIRLYHPEILDDAELLVIDNHPDGPCAQALKDFESWIPNYRYLPKSEISGTAVRDFVFQEATGQFVVCIDCHILIVPGALKQLIDYFDAHADTNDLLQGPLLYDNLTSISTHFAPKWRAGMYGVWETGAAGKDVNDPPFEIPMQGLGLFACRRAAWPGFNPAFRGFGGEEGYIHGKFRQRGGRTLCLPFLRWTHRFNRPAGVPYVNRWEDRIRNYFVGFRELGWDTAPIAEHFKEVLGEESATRIVKEIEKEFSTRGRKGTARDRRINHRGNGKDPQSLLNAAPLVPASSGDSAPADPFASVWDDASLTRQRQLIRRVLAIAEARSVALYLYWGTLLGHVREGRILPWDDDVDFALFHTERLGELRAALQADGLKTHDLRSASDLWMKVYDPSYPVTPHRHCPWTWPFIDIFVYSVERTADGAFPVSACPRDIILPGKRTTFEGARCWQPEQPAAVLDYQYRDWRTFERSPDHDHRTETSIVAPSTRRLVTDASGRKVFPPLTDDHLQPEERENPLSRDIFLPLLRAWIDLCDQHGIRYSIFWGTLLGQLRNQRIIPYDQDVDVVVGRSGVETLYALPGRAPGCVFNDELKDQPDWREGEVRLVVRRDLASLDGQRYDHRGRPTSTQVDACAFNGPLARLIMKLPASRHACEYRHLDVDLFTDISHFNPYPAVHEVDELPELEERILEGLRVSCLKDALPYIVAYYGADYMTPDYVFRDGGWVHRTS